MIEVEEKLKEWWLRKRDEIESRLNQFKLIRGGGNRRIFEELCFCLMTPQSSATSADRALRHMIRTGLLYEGTTDQLAKIISASGILYGENKARYLVEARGNLLGPEPTISFQELLVEDPRQARENVVLNIKGLGYKETSHFLRNIGYEGLAILDRHILRTLKEAGIIDDLPRTISKRTYLDLECAFLDYAERLGIPPDALDMVMWSAKTGHVFK